MSEDESEELRDVDAVADVIRRRVLRAIVPAVKKLDRVARGINRFAHDHERVACVVLARLAPVVLASAAANRGDALEQEDEEWAAQWLTPEKVALLEKLQQHNTREENAEDWGRRFLEGAGMPMGVDTLDKAREYGRTWWDHCEVSRVHTERTTAHLMRRRRRR